MGQISIFYCKYLVFTITVCIYLINPLNLDIALPHVNQVIVDFIYANIIAIKGPRSLFIHHYTKLGSSCLGYSNPTVRV